MNPCGLGSLLGHAFSVVFLQTPRYFWLYGVRFICGLCPKQFSFCQVFYRSWFFDQLSRSKYARFAWASELSCRTLKWCMADLNIFKYVLMVADSKWKNHLGTVAGRGGQRTFQEFNLGWFGQCWAMVSSSYLIPSRSGGLGVPSQEDGPGFKLAWQVAIHLAFCGQTNHDQATIPRWWYDNVPEWRKIRKETVVLHTPF